MGDLRISVGDLNFTARWEADAPRTREALRGWLPIRSRLIHCNWSGESTWIPFGDRRPAVGLRECHLAPRAGSVLIYVGDISECEILFPYGACSFISKVGPLAGNHFATVVPDDGWQDRLGEVGRRVLWQGAQDVRIEEPVADLLISGGTVVTAERSLAADVAIRDGRILEVSPGLDRRYPEAERLDARGLLVLPGCVDVHTHTRLPVDDEPDRFYQDSVAAAFGGTTTFLAFNNPGTGISEQGSASLLAGLEEFRVRTEGEAAVDFALSLVISGQQPIPFASCRS